MKTARRSIAACLCVLTLAGCAVSAKPKRNLTKVEEVTDISAPRTVGTVYSAREGDIYSSQQGVIQSLSANLGDRVGQGQTLATLLPDKEDSDLRGELVYRQRELAFAKDQREKIQTEIATPTAAIEREQQAMSNEKLAEINRIEAQIVSVGTEMEQSLKHQQNAMRDLQQSIIDMMYTRGDAIQNFDKYFSDDQFRRIELFYPHDGPAKAVESKMRLFSEHLNDAVESEDIVAASTEAIAIGEEVRSIGNNFTPSQKLTIEKINELRNAVSRDLSNLLTQVTNYENSRGKLAPLEAEKKQVIARTEQRIIEKTTTAPRPESRAPELIQADIERIQVQLGGGRTVYAPFAGVITQRHVNVGSSVHLTQPLFTIVDDRNKFVRFTVTEAEFPFIKKGTVIEFAPVVDSSARYKATVARISQAIDPVTKKIEVEADIDDGQKDTDRILSQMSALVFLPIDSPSKLLAVPAEAVELNGTENVVWIVDANNDAQQRTVTIRFTYDGKSYIENGIAAGEKVVIRAAAK